MRVLFFLALFIYLLPTKSNTQTSNQFKGYNIALNKKTWTTNKAYYVVTQATDSTVFLYWGNDNFKRQYHYDFDLSSAEKLHIKWTSKNYLILQYATGSGVWVDIALPIDKEEKSQNL